MWNIIFLVVGTIFLTGVGIYIIIVMKFNRMRILYRKAKSLEATHPQIARCLARLSEIESKRKEVTNQAKREKRHVSNEELSELLFDRKISNFEFEDLKRFVREAEKA